ASASMSESGTKPRSSWMRRRQGSTSEDSNPCGYLARNASNSASGRSRSAVTLAPDHVHRAEGRDDVRELVALEQPVQPAHVDEARAAHVHLVRRPAAVAHEIEAELAVGRLVRDVDLAGRHLGPVDDQLEVVDQRLDLAVDQALVGERATAVVDADRPV